MFRELNSTFSTIYERRPKSIRVDPAGNSWMFVAVKTVGLRVTAVFRTSSFLPSQPTQHCDRPQDITIVIWLLCWTFRPGGSSRRRAGKTALVIFATPFFNVATSGYVRCRAWAQISCRSALLKRRSRALLQNASRTNHGNQGHERYDGKAIDW